METTLTAPMTKPAQYPQSRVAIASTTLATEKGKEYFVQKKERKKSLDYTVKQFS